jgi:hypothetical protein
MEEFTIDQIIGFLSAIFTLILIIIFIVMAGNIAKTKKAIFRMQDVIIAWAKKEGITKEKHCPGCNSTIDLPYNQPKGDMKCPKCGYKNHIDFSDK